MGTPKARVIADEFEVSAEQAGRDVAEFLREHGGSRFEFDVVDQGNFATFDVTETLVLDRGESQDPARRIAELLGIDPEHVLSQPLAENVLDIEVTLLLGRDVSTLDLSDLKRRP